MIYLIKYTTMEEKLSKKYEKVYIYLGLIISLVFIILGIVIFPITVFVFAIGFLLFIKFTINLFNYLKTNN